MIGMVAAHIFLGLSIAAPVGPINIEIVKRGLTYGFLSALFVGLGGMSSDLLLMGAMFLGMAAFLSVVWVKILLLMMGALVLIHSGLVSMKSPHLMMDQRTENSTVPSSIYRGSFLKGFLIASTNPMNLLFWISIYGSVLSSAFEKENLLYSFLISMLVFVGIGLWNLNMAFMTHFGRFLASPFVLRFIHIGASLILIGFGGRMGWQGVQLLIQFV
ncbi:LysE family transporter [Halobacillus litoralis]|uniref:LysE family translocator n=1 Tax=Halobacillus litoralis TaxID=45668 RepID=UPI001CD57341|nr:LysE family transporter [Halobacillus litoralis]MCA0971248.1 LysE family transporter [Halobacillus litoralis]